MKQKAVFNKAMRVIDSCENFDHWESCRRYILLSAPRLNSNYCTLLVSKFNTKCTTHIITIDEMVQKRATP